MNEAAHNINLKKIKRTAENSIVYYCNSLTPGIISANSSYPLFLGEKLLINVVNKGKSRDTSQYGIDHLNDIFRFKPVLVLLEFGTNDYFNGLCLAQNRNNLVDRINKIMTYSSEGVILKFVHPDMIDCILENPIVTEYNDEDSIQILIDIGLEYANVIDSIGKNHNLLHEDYFSEGIICNSTLLTKDGLQRNGKGNIKMAENIFLEFYDTFKISKMIRD